MASKYDSWIVAGLAVAVGAGLLWKKKPASAPAKPSASPALYDGPRDYDGHVYYDVKVDRLAVRTLPSADSDVIGSLPVGAIVTSTGYTVGGLSTLTKKYVEVMLPPEETRIGWAAAAGLSPHNA
jgi:hypothetical protein